MLKIKFFKKMTTFVTIFSSIILFSGCSSKVGTTTFGEKVPITKKDVHAKTKMSETIFLEPVAPEEQIIYFRVRNTSDEQLNITSMLKTEFEKRGFIVTRNPKEANFMVQANVLKVGEMDLNEQKNYLGAGFGGGAIAAGTTVLTGGDNSNIGKAAVAGALVGLAIESLRVKDIHYAMVTDVEIRQRPLEGEEVKQAEALAGQMGQSGVSLQAATNNNVKWKKYRTRIISSAYAPGLEFSQAQPFLEDGLVKSLANTM